MSRQRCVVFVVSVVFVLVSSIPVFGQAVYGSIIGTATDPQGAAVPNAKVTVTDVRKGTTDTATTNESGNYSVTHLIPDTYSVKIEAQGFKTVEQKSVTVSADTAARVDLQFQLGQANETVEVTSEAPQLKTDRADVSTTFNERYVEDLPVLGRNFTTFELLSPGTQKLTGWSHASTENPQGSQQIFVNGQHFSGTGYELDGTDNQDPILGIIVVNPNLDAITETKVALQNYDAEFGKAVAGIVTVQTKSGSNALHGSAFWFRRTDATEARDPFTQDPAVVPKLPEDRWNQFGFSAGGPIIKDKLFFFADYQGTRQASGVTNQLTIPTAKVIQTCTGAGDGSGYCKLDQYTSIFGNGPAGQLYDPTTGDQLTGTGRTPFCGPSGFNSSTNMCNVASETNWIPLTRIPAAVQNILKAFPAPQNGDVQNNFFSSGSGPFHANGTDVRIDWAKSQSLSVFGRFSLQRFNIAGSGSLGELGGVGTGIGGLSGSAVTHNYSLATGFDKTFSSTLLTDFRFGWFKYNPTTHKPDEGKTPFKDFGVPNVNFGDVFTSGMPSIRFGPNNLGPWSNIGDSLDPARCNCPLIESEQQFQFVNNWTKVIGNHQWKFGADIRYAENLRVPSDSDRAGQFNFEPGPTSDGGIGGNGIGSFLLGDVHNFSRFVSTSLNAAERQKRWFFYGQDSWRATQKLTINYGLRWENYFPERVNEKGNGGFANPVEGIIRVGGYGKYGLDGNIDKSWKSFAPRLGIAYQLTPKTVVRMGYGRSFDMGVFGSNFGHTVTQNLPVLVNQSVRASNNIANNGFGPTVNDDFFPAFTLTQGPPVYSFPPIPSNGVLPLGGPPVCTDLSGNLIPCTKLIITAGVPNEIVLSPGNNVGPRMRPTRQTLPTLDAWNVTVQRQITSTLSASVAYVGNKGTHVFAGNGPAYDANQAPYGPGTAVVTAAGQVPSFKANTPTDQRRPYYNAFTYPDFIDPISGQPMVCCNSGAVMGNYFGNSANAHYNALQVVVEKRFSQGLQFQSNYTWSHAYNYTNDNGFAYVGNRKGSYGRDDFNRNHVFIFNSTYELPFGKGKAFAGNAGRAADLIIGGWQLTNTTNWSSGLPWTAFANNCGAVQDVGPCIPDMNGSFKVGAGSFDPATHSVRFFTPVAPLAYPTSALTVGTDLCSVSRPSSAPFSLPACGVQGNAGRNTFTGPRHFTNDMALLKNFKVTERVNAQFRMEAFNVFNHPVYAFSADNNPGGACIDCALSSTNGLIKDIENGTTMRQLQFALRLTF